MRSAIIKLREKIMLSYKTVFVIVILLMMSVCTINATAAEIPIYTECSAVGNHFPTFHSYVFKLKPGDESAYDNYYWLQDYHDAGFNAIWAGDPAGLCVDSSIVDSCQYPSNRFGRNDPEYALEELLSDYEIKLLVRPNITRIVDNGVVTNQSHTTDWKSESVNADDDNDVYVWEDDFFGDFTDCGGGEYGRFPDPLTDEYHFFIDPVDIDTTEAFLIGDAGSSLSLTSQMTQTAMKKALTTTDTVTIYLKTWIDASNNDMLGVAATTPILTMYSGYYGSTGWIVTDSSSLTRGTITDSAGADASTWYAFELNLSSGDKGFALKWHELYKIDGFENIIPVPVGVGINRIRYEGKAHEKLFKYDENGEFEVDVIDNDYWNRFNTAFDNARSRFDNNILGYMGWEPWEFAYEGTRMLTDEFNQNGYDIYHQFPMYGAGDTATSTTTNPMYKWLDDNEGPGTKAMVFDAFPIKWTHSEYSYDGGAEDSLSIQRAWDDMINVADGADLDTLYDRYVITS